MGRQESASVPYSLRCLETLRSRLGWGMVTHLIIMKSQANALEQSWWNLTLEQLKKNLQNRWRRRYLLLAITFCSSSFWAVKSLQLNVPLKNFNQHILPVSSPLIYTHIIYIIYTHGPKLLR